MGNPNVQQQQHQQGVSINRENLEQLFNKNLAGKSRWRRQSDAAKSRSEPEPTTMVQQATANAATTTAATTADHHPAANATGDGKFCGTRWVHGAAKTASNGGRHEPGRIPASVQR